MKNELFTIGPLTVYGYGFMIATGVLAAWIVTEYLSLIHIELCDGQLDENYAIL